MTEAEVEKVRDLAVRIERQSLKVEQYHGDIKVLMEQYRGDIRVLIEQMGTIRNYVGKFDSALYGDGGERSPGIILQIQSLIHSRKIMAWALNAVVGVLMLLIGAVFHRIFGL